MKKYLLLACGVLLFATSCLKNGGPAGSSSYTYAGNLTVKEMNTDKVTYSDERASVTVSIPNIIEPKFDIIFNDMKFDSAMPVKLDVEFNCLPFKTTMSEDETTINYTFDVKDVVPTVGGVPYDKYKADYIKGCIGRPVTIEFSMSSKDKIVQFSTATE